MTTERHVPPGDDGDGCDCTELCSMGPTCPGAILARLPGAGCWRTTERLAEIEAEKATSPARTGDAETAAAEVLAEHGALGYDDCDGCECGADVQTHAAHRAHVAAALHDAGLLAGDGLRGRLTALADEWEAMADASAASATAREGLSDASELADFAAAMTRRAAEVRALLDDTDGQEQEVEG